MTDMTSQRRGVTNEGGFFSPYYLYDLMERQHRDELDPEGRNTNRKMLPRVFRSAYARLSSESTPGQAWEAWYQELFTALGWLPEHIARLEEPVPTSRYGLVPISHGGFLNESDEAPLAFIDLHGFGANLDRDRYEREKHLSFTAEPITRALEFALDFNATRWAIVANGTEMRLYRKGGSVARQYVKVDFAALFDSDDTKEWTAFWGLFRRDAFVPAPDGRCLLDRVIEESQRHATRIADDLRENILIALEALIQGILDDSANRPVLGNPAGISGETLQQLFEESLYFLYRLLFILYAESRDLLPVGENLVYHDAYSFEHLRDLADKPMPDAEGDRTYFIESLRTMLRMLYKGFPDEALKAKLGSRIPFIIPAYNGQLFDPARTALLDRCHIPDRAMHTVVRELSLSRPRRAADQRERFSYADLGIDQLGSIYEGLLVYEPTIAAEAMTLVTIRNEERWVTHAQAEEYGLEWEPDKARRPGQFYLRLWGGRRKSSASYYTPHEITSFLVKEALEPLVEPIIAGCGERDDRGRPRRRSDEILDLKVCDPAMGSGAFLVQACRYLAEAYGRARIAAGDDEDGRISQAELAHFKRRVAERCLYGVDLNPMAVELAKVSLWLESLAADRPLEFLDAHLRHGNSLIGAPLRDAEGKFTIEQLSLIPDAALKEVSKEATAEDKARARKRMAVNRADVKRLKGTRAGQGVLAAREFATWDRSIGQELDRRFQYALTARRDIEKSDEKLTQPEAVALIHEKERRYAELRESPEFQALHRICDLWCAVWFWPRECEVEPPTTQVYRELMSGLLGLDFGNSLTPEQTAAYLGAAEQACQQQDFFHWEMEFPEVWREPNGAPKAKGGFDAVVGNPPWESVQENTDEFFGNYMPLIRSFTKTEKRAIVDELRGDPAIDAHYRSYRHRFPTLNNFVKASKIYPYQGSGAPNLFKMFVERFAELARRGGDFRIVIPSSIYTDDSSTKLREMLFDKMAVQFLVSIENRKKIFSIHSSFKIVLLGATKGRSSEAVPCAFWIGKRPDGTLIAPDLAKLKERLAALDSYLLPISQETIKRFAPDTRSILELKSPRDVEITSTIYRVFPRLADNPKFDAGRELNRSDDADLFLPPGNGRIPILEGKNIHHFSCNFTPVELFGEYEAIHERIPDEADISHARLIWRRVAASTNETTLIACLLPPSTASVHTLFSTKPSGECVEDLALWCSCMNSFTINYIIRQIITTDNSLFFVKMLPVPREYAADVQQAAIVSRAARLMSQNTQLDGLPPLLEPLIQPEERVIDARDPRLRAALRAEIDALVADLYGLSEPDFAYILSTFPLLDRSQPALPGEPKSTITRDLALLELFELRDKQPPEDVVTFFREAGAEIGTVTGAIRGLAERVEAAQRLGAVAYIPSSRGEESEVEEEVEAEDEEPEEEVED